MPEILRFSRYLAPIGVLALLAMLTASTASAQSNSSEAICSSPDALFCDDFEDGFWWLTGEDPSGTGNDGWEGCLYCKGSGAPQPAVQPGAAGTANAVTTRAITPTDGAGVNGKFSIQTTDELYIRWYWWFSDGYVFGHQKEMTFNLPLSQAGSYDFGLLHHPFQSTQFQYYTPHETGWRRQNVGTALGQDTGGWYLFEAHLKLNSPGSANGLLEIWADYCGTDGLGCEGQPQTLRMQHADMIFRTNSSQIGSIWVNNWSNYLAQGASMTTRPSEGEMRYDQIVVSKKRIGPMNSSGVPAPAPAPAPGPVGAPTWAPGS